MRTEFHQVCRFAKIPSIQNPESNVGCKTCYVSVCLQVHAFHIFKKCNSIIWCQTSYVRLYTACQDMTKVCTTALKNANAMCLNSLNISSGVYGLHPSPAWNLARIPKIESKPSFLEQGRWRKSLEFEEKRSMPRNYFYAFEIDYCRCILQIRTSFSG